MTVMQDNPATPASFPKQTLVRSMLGPWTWKHEIGFLVLAIAVYLWGTMSIWPWSLDDAYISLEYAQHLARFGILSFNLHHLENPPTEGFSSPLWIFSLAGLILTGVRAVPMMKLLSLAGGFGVLVTTSLILWRRLRCSAAPCLALLSTCFPLLYYSVNGMEMTWVWTLLFAWLFFHSSPRPSPLRVRLAAGFFLALLTLIRPEGIMFWAVAMLDTGIDGYRERNLRAVLRERLWVLVLPLILWSGYEAFRLLHYGMPFPNTYYAKWLTRSGPLGEKIPTGVYYSMQYTLGFLGVLWPVALGVELLVRPTPLNDGWRLIRRPLLLSALAGWLFLWVIVSDNLPFYRFQMYTVLPFIVGGSFLLGEAIAKAGTLRWRLALFLAAAAIAGGFAMMNFDVAKRERQKVEQSGATWHQATKHIELGRHLRTLFRPGDLLLFEEMGAVPYYSGLDFIDFMGLNDRRIAKIIYDHRQENTGYAFPPVRLSKEAISRRPDGVLLRAKRPMSDPALRRWSKNMSQVHEVWFSMMSMPGFRSCYEYLEMFKLNDSYYVYIYRLKNGCDPLADQGAEPDPELATYLKKKLDE